MSKPTILIVDDSPTVRQQVGIALAQAGYQVAEAEDGIEGLNAIRQNERIALVILDVNMPEMNGLEMLEELDRSGRKGEPPVLMLTTEGQPSLVKRAKTAGARGWIVKPFKADQLVATVEKLTAVATPA